MAPPNPPSATERLEVIASTRGITPEDLVDWVESAFAAAKSTRIEPGRELSSGELETLESEGLGAGRTATDPIVSSFGRYMRLVEEALDARQAAKKLGVSPSRVRQLLGESRLYGLKPMGDWRLPTWQFGVEGRGTVPGIGTVIRALPEGLHPLSVEGFMTSPKPELSLDGNSTSPIEWLAGGGDAEAVAELAADL